MPANGVEFETVRGKPIWLEMVYFELTSVIEGSLYYPIYQFSLPVRDSFE